MKVAALLNNAKKKGIMIATAESCTGGLVCAALTDIAGSSAVVERGFVTYSNDAKQEMLGVSLKTLKAFGAVSEEVAREMALGALAASHAQLSVSVTGIAGPGGSESKPEGRVCFAIAALNMPIQTQTVEFGALGRDRVRLAARDHALDLLFKATSETGE